MKNVFIVIYLMISNLSFAQQNLFNIPSGQLTSEGKWFYQHQLNSYDFNNMSSKQHFAYGATKNLEIGLNYLNFNFLNSKKLNGRDYFNSSPSEKLIALTLQVQFFLTSSFSFNLGTQSGITNLINSGIKNFTYKHYGLLAYFNDQSHLRLTGGFWVADKRFNGKDEYTGLLAGGEWMFYDGMYVMGDWISGSTKNSVSVVGGMVDVARGIQFCFGYLIPNSNSSEGEGLVFEINLFEI